jgi:hypothetical protein
MTLRSLWRHWRPAPGHVVSNVVAEKQPLLNSEWVVLGVSGLPAGVKGGRSPAQRTLDAGWQPLRWPSWPMRHVDVIGRDEQERFVCMTGS